MGGSIDEWLVLKTGDADGHHVGNAAGSAIAVAIERSESSASGVFGEIRDRDLRGAVLKLVWFGIIGTFACM